MKLFGLNIGGGDKDTPFAPGQVWTYDCREAEPESRLKILKVESDPVLGEIVHISVNNLRIKNPSAPSGITPSAGHLPFASDALRACVKNLEKTHEPLGDWEEGYQTWRQARDQGKAGIFTVPVKEIAQHFEKAFESHGPA